MRILQSVLAVLLLALGATPAFSYAYTVCSGGGQSINLRLPSNSWTIRSSDVSFPVGYWQDGLNNGISQFNRNPSNFFYVRASDTNGINLNNGESEIWGTTDQTILLGSPARAYWWFDCYWLGGLVAKMKEGDIAFDYTNTATNPFEWTATRQKGSLSVYSGNGRLLQATAIHEMGHAAGLLHENRTYNVMGSDYNHLSTHGGTSNAYIGEDTGNGTVFLYGLWASGPQDLAVSHWRYLGTSGEYSTHARTRMFNPTTGAELSFLIGNGEPRYYVTRGGQVRAEFTYENVGRDTQNGILLRYYISTDAFISNTDTFIGSATINLSRDWVSTANVTLTIPSTLLPKTNYWLGVFINPAGTIPETDRSNNRTYVGIRTN